MRRRPFLAALLPAVLPPAAASGHETASRLVDRSNALPAPAPASTPRPTASVASLATRSPSRDTTTADAGADPPRARTDAPRAAADAADPPPAGITHRPLRFPADHGAHADAHIEWWYVTGWLRDAGRPPVGRLDGPARPAGPDSPRSAGSGGSPRRPANPANPASPVSPVSAADTRHAPAGNELGDARPPDFGFQVTFFRMRTELAEDSASRFAARQLVFAHVALTDLARGRAPEAGALLHDQRAAREGFGIAAVPGPAGEQVVRLRDWTLARAAGGGADGRSSHLRIEAPCDGFALSLALDGTQPVLLQGDAGYSRKGPRPEQASRYYSEPQLRVRGHVGRSGAPLREVEGRAWLDHEWSDALMAPGAAGWDWIGINLLDGGALMAFRMRDREGRPLWAGGSYRDASGALRVFTVDEVEFRPLRHWRSPRTQAEYPVEWQLHTPAGRFRLAALRDDQELDSRASTGAVYWEGLSSLQDEDGRVAGWGYLELTGYVERLRL
jgi:predicted secreted hydrolase